MKKIKRMEPLYAGNNKYGQFIIDEDTKEGVYGDDNQIRQLLYKTNSIVHLMNEVIGLVNDLHSRLEEIDAMKKSESKNVDSSKE